MDNQAGKYKRGFLVILSIILLFSPMEAPEDFQVIVMGVLNQSDIPKDRILDFSREFADGGLPERPS